MDCLRAFAHLEPIGHQLWSRCLMATIFCDAEWAIEGVGALDNEACAREGARSHEKADQRTAAHLLRKFEKLSTC